MAETETKELKQEQKKVVSRVKLKKKFWYPLIAPPSFGQREIGESYLPSLESGIGKTVDIALKEVTGNVKDQNSYLRFKIIGSRDNHLFVETRGYFLTPSFVRRAVKKSTNRIDAFFVGKLKDGKQAVIKVLLITIRKIQRSLRAKLQKQAQDFLREEMKNADWETFIHAVASQKIQQAMRKKLLKLYPLRDAALRSIILQEKNTPIRLPEIEMETTTSDTSKSDTSEGQQAEEVSA